MGRVRTRRGCQPPPRLSGLRPEPRHGFDPGSWETKPSTTGVHTSIPACPELQQQQSQ